MPYNLIIYLKALKKKGGLRNSSSRLKLCYIHDVQTTIDKWDEVATFCPATNSVFLDSPDEEVLKDLSCFKKLRKLKLSKVNFSQIVDSMKIIPNQLSTIEIVSGRGTLDLGLLRFGKNLFNQIHRLKMGFSPK